MFLSLLQSSEHSNDHAEDCCVRYFVVRDDDWGHLAVRGFEADVVWFGVEVFYGGFVVDESNDDIASVGGLLFSDEDVVVVEDAGFDH